MVSVAVWTAVLSGAPVSSNCVPSAETFSIVQLPLLAPALLTTRLSPWRKPSARKLPPSLRASVLTMVVLS